MTHPPVLILLCAVVLSVAHISRHGSLCHYALQMNRWQLKEKESRTGCVQVTLCKCSASLEKSTLPKLSKQSLQALTVSHRWRSRQMGSLSAWGQRPPKAAIRLTIPNDVTGRRCSKGILAERKPPGAKVKSLLLREEQLRSRRA